MNKYLQFLLLLFACSKSYAQYNSPENYFWAFGINAGINFSTGSPVVTSTNIETDEGSASVCDSSGNLLFYTDGTTIWNKMGIVMPQGASIVSFSTTSTSQGALIMPRIAHPGQYFVFSLEQYALPGRGRLAYCIVDMSLDGGLGDVVVSSKETVIDTSFSEKLIAIPGNSSNFWLITLRTDANEFYAYNVTASGINTVPVTSAPCTTLGYDLYLMKCSPDRSKIAITRSENPTDRSIELYDFNIGTGVISNCRVIASGGSFYSCEFSSDSKMLYVQRASPPSLINQYNISLPSISEVMASEYMVTSSTTFTHTDMRLAPDGKIYFKSMNTGISSSFLDCISNPNLAGAMCGYASHSINLLSGNVRYGLPNLTWKINYVPATAVRELSQQDVTIYPNPVGNELKIKSDIPVSSVVIINLLGKVIYCSPIMGNDCTINTVALAKGVYILSVNNSLHYRFVKD